MAGYHGRGESPGLPWVFIISFMRHVDMNNLTEISQEKFIDLGGVFQNGGNNPFQEVWFYKSQTDDTLLGSIGRDMDDDFVGFLLYPLGGGSTPTEGGRTETLHSAFSPSDHEEVLSELDEKARSQDVLQKLGRLKREDNKELRSGQDFLDGDMKKEETYRVLCAARVRNPKNAARQLVSEYEGFWITDLEKTAVDKLLATLKNKQGEIQQVTLPTYEPPSEEDLTKMRISLASF